jgi:hypothetical protein
MRPCAFVSVRAVGGAFLAPFGFSAASRQALASDSSDSWLPLSAMQ